VKRLRRELAREFPAVAFSFLPADIVSQILNFGAPAAIDVQVDGSNLQENRVVANKLLARQLFAMWSPDELVRALAQAQREGHLGEIKPHFFSFGGLLQTARWAQAVAQGSVTLDSGQGFRVDPAG